MTTLIDTIDLSYCYLTKNNEEVLALNHVNFTLNKGEHCAIIGENGAGKSTLLQALRGEILPSPKNGGKIFWYENGTPSDSPLSARAICSIVSPKEQDYYARQNWKVNCLEIILAACSNDYILYREPTTEEVLRAVEIAKQLDAEYLLYTPIKNLSQGQLRIMLIARALIKQSPVILLDEPLNGLDKKSQELFWKTLERLATQKTENSPTIILTTHYFPLPNYISRCYEMKEGKLSEIIDPPHSSLFEIVEKNSTPDIPKEPKIPQGLKIIINNASIYLNHKEIVKHVNWQIKPQEHWTLIGHNGSGKSTLLQGILGFLPIAFGGNIRRLWYPNINEKYYQELTTLSEIKEKIRLVSDTLQTHYSFDDTVKDILFSGIDGNIGVYREKTTEEENIVNELLYQLNLVHLRHRPFRSLSTGQARKTLIARAIIGNPALLLLDEPFSGLDPRNKQEIKDFIEFKIKEISVQTILVSHIDTDYLPSSTRFATLFAGEFQELI